MGKSTKKTSASSKKGKDNKRQIPIPEPEPKGNNRGKKQANGSQQRKQQQPYTGAHQSHRQAAGKSSTSRRVTFWLTVFVLSTGVGLTSVFFSQEIQEAAGEIYQDYIHPQVLVLQETWREYGEGNLHASDQNIPSDSEHSRDSAQQEAEEARQKRDAQSREEKRAAEEEEQRRVEEERRAEKEKEALRKEEEEMRQKVEKERIEAERKAEEERKEREAKRLEEERKAEEKRLAAERQRQEEEERRIAEEKRLEGEREALRKEEERIAAEKKAEEERIEAERKAAEEREAKRKEEERVAAEKKAEEERKAAEEARKAEEERRQAERKAAEEMEAKLAEEARLLAERRAEEERVAAAKREEAESEARRQEEERIVAERKAEEERIAVEEAKRKEEEERILAENERVRKIEEERLAAEQRANEEARLQAERREEEERIAAEEARILEERRAEEERIAADQKANEEARILAEKKAEEEARILAERKAEEESRILAEKRAEEESRILAEKRAEEERIVTEQKAIEEARILAERKAEEERIAAEQKANEAARIMEERRAEEERIAAERKAEEERLAAEQQAAAEEQRQEAQRKVLEEEKRRVDEERKAQEELAAKKLEEERHASEKQAKEKASEDRVTYKFASITNDADFPFREDLDAADALLEKGDIEAAVDKFDSILRRKPSSPRAHYGKALTLDKLGFKYRSNEYLEQAIEFLVRILAMENVPSDLVKMAGRKLADRQSFRGWGAKAAETFKYLTEKFPDDLDLQKEHGVSYLMVGQNAKARAVFNKILSARPDSGFAKVHLGFILKTVDNELEEAVRLMAEGIESGEKGTEDGRFYLHLGDALVRLGREPEARKVFKAGEEKKVFLSEWQRSLYNVDRLTGRPWWTPEQTGYQDFLQLLKENWQTIRDEGLAQLDAQTGSFLPEEENLRDTGDWKQFTLYQQGRKNMANCEKAPKTCELIEQIPDAKNCRRGQVKFSVMSPGIHVWPHVGPTNCRIRAHLGLVVPPGPSIRVVTETREWKEGEFVIFDDSFEHEVWHKGTEHRLVLIVDFWHPELTPQEKKTLTPI